MSTSTSSVDTSSADNTSTELLPYQCAVCQVFHSGINHCSLLISSYSLGMISLLLACGIIERHTAGVMIVICTTCCTNLSQGWKKDHTPMLEFILRLLFSLISVISYILASYFYMLLFVYLICVFFIVVLMNRETTRDIRMLAQSRETNV